MFFSTIKKFRLRKIEKGWKLFHKANYESARKKICQLTSCKETEICLEANRIAGLAFYRQKLYEDAISHLTITSSLSNQQHDWYNLAMAFAKANRIPEAEDAFKEIYRAKSKHDYQYAISLPTMIFQYLRALKQNKAFATAYPRVIELRGMYEALRKSDESTLAASGLPPVQSFIKEIIPILKSQFPDKKVKDWIKDLSSRLDKNRKDKAWG